jgi:alkylation response protein AidB-like acyl-CoA dehydrogenase
MNIRELTGDITARAAEIEAGRRVPPDLVTVLRSIGAFRLFVPRSHGGLELDLPTGLEIIGALAKIDGSVGWTAMIGNGSDLFASMLPRETYERVYANGPDAILAGSVTPAGTAERVPGGWRVSGRWPFASGCQHADWMAGFCILTEGGNPVLDGGGAPVVRGIFLPARDWRIEDTWYAAGLKGTGSHHIALSDKVVPAACFFDYPNGAPCLPGPLYQTVPQLLPLLHGAFAVGMAEGALDDLIALANTGRQQLRAAVSMRESEIFQGELGRVAAEVRAARAYLQVQAASHWRRALAGTLKDDALLAQARRRPYGLSAPARASPMRASRWAAAARFMRPHRCNGGCAIFTPRGNTPRCSSDTT